MRKELKIKLHIYADFNNEIENQGEVYRRVLSILDDYELAYQVYETEVQDVQQE